MARDPALMAVTPTQQDVFLQVYRETGLMAQAAKAAGTTKSAIEKFVQGKHAEAEVFALNVQEAAAQWGDVIKAELTRRAITGVERAVWHKGQEVGSETVYSDTLLALMATNTLPEYKKVPEQTNAPVQIVINTFSDKPAPEIVIDVTPTATLDNDHINPLYRSDLE